MPLIVGFVTPHPPLLIPEIGGPRISEVAATAEAMRQAAVVLAELEIDVLIFVSPHSLMVKDAFAIRAAAELVGDFTRFGHPEVGFVVKHDLDTAAAIESAAAADGLPVVSPEENDLDWGVTVAYFYLGASRPIVNLSVTSLSLNDHFAFGRAVGRALNQSEKRYALVASGDLSHCLKPDGPYGYTPEGPLFDERVRTIAASGKLEELLSIDDDFARLAGECGLRPMTVLAGGLSCSQVEPEVLSYEGPFGVGYMTAKFLVKGDDADV